MREDHHPAVSWLLVFVSSSLASWIHKPLECHPSPNMLTCMSTHAYPLSTSCMCTQRQLNLLSTCTYMTCIQRHTFCRGWSTLISTGAAWESASWSFRLSLTEQSVQTQPLTRFDNRASLWPANNENQLRFQSCVDIRIWWMCETLKRFSLGPPL